MSSSRRPLSILHTADVHLDSDGYGDAAGRRRTARVAAALLARIVDRALADRVDLLLIAGDLFDHNRVPDETVAFVRAELGRLRQPVVIMPGNHDVLVANGRLRPARLHGGGEPRARDPRPDGEVIDLPELDAVVWGRAMQEHTPASSRSPTSGLPGRPALVPGHGPRLLLRPERQRPERSSPIFADEVRDTGWDYVALGHHHVRTDVSQGRVTACYAGAPMLEWGDEQAAGSVLRIDFSVADGVRVQARPLD